VSAERGTTIEELPRSNIIQFPMGEDIQFADVSPGSNRPVNFPCIVDGGYFKGKNVTNMVVTLEATATHLWYSKNSDHNAKWDVKISPKAVELKPYEKKDFTVMITVPPKISHYSKGEVVISGLVKTSPDNKMYRTNEAMGKIRIEYYYDWNLESPDVTGSVDKGNDLSFKAEIINSGNARDIFFQDVINSDVLKDHDIEVEFPVNIEIAEKSTETVEVVVKTSEKTPKGTYPIEFVSYPTDVDENRNEANPFYHIRFVLTVEPDFIEEYLVPSLLGITIILIAVIYVLVKPKRGKVKVKMNESTSVATGISVANNK
jgi:hypothetical protein